jgi:hypothetical protein
MGSSALGLRARNLPYAYPVVRAGIQHAGALGIVILLLLCQSLHDRQHRGEYIPHLHGLRHPGHCLLLLLG